jgi:hypothetical protein
MKLSFHVCMDEVLGCEDVVGDCAVMIEAIVRENPGDCRPTLLIQPEKSWLATNPATNGATICNHIAVSASKAAASKMREIMRECCDLLIVQGVRDVGHRAAAAAEAST